MSSHEPLSCHLAVVSQNQTVGDWAGNLERTREALAETTRRGARLVLFPEMGLSGYSLGDRLPRRGTLERSFESLRALAPATEGLVALVGLPITWRGVLLNAMAVVADGEVRAFVAKENLATGDVEYENRWFQGWRRGRVDTYKTPDGQRVPLGSLVFSARGLGRFALEICEDGWKGLRPGSAAALSGAEVLLNPSASWFVIGKHRTRQRMIEQVSREDHCAYAYASLLGCDATRLVFDGSLIIAENGRIVEEGRRFLFRERVEVVDRVVDLEALRLARREEGSWREQAEELDAGGYGPTPTLLELPGDYRTAAPAPADEPYWSPSVSTTADPSLAWLEPRIGRITERDLPHLELELALALALRDYTNKTGIQAIALALSGGRDSAMVALIVHRMLRYEHPDASDDELRSIVARTLLTAYLSTSNSGHTTREAARGLAESVGATHHEVDLQEAFSLHRQLCEEASGTALSWDDPVDDLTLQNVQARLRGSFIWMLANRRRALLLSTSNKSEAAVGYTTMDGDTSGGVAPIADVPKSLVTLWLRWARSFHGYDALDAVNVQAPTAELRPPEHQQTDEADLMPFEILDQLLYAFVQKAQDPLEMFRTLWPRFEAHYRGDAKAFAAHVERFVKLTCFAQWKRERFAISFRVTAFDLDPKTGFRFPAVQAPFTEELADLRAWVEGL